MSPLNKSAFLLPGKLRKPILCYVTDRKLLPGNTDESRLEWLLKKIESLAVAGVDWIQIREKDLPGNALAALTRNALERISRAAPGKSAEGLIAPRMIVNDRLDVALAERAGGVHLGENSLPVAEVKRLLMAHSRDFVVGVSCHSLDAARAAAADGADYLFFGPVFPTPSKAAFGLPQGLDRLREVCASVSIPVLAIGGITVDNAPACLAAGASGLAAVRLFQDTPHPSSTVHTLRQNL